MRLTDDELERAAQDYATRRRAATMAGNAAKARYYSTHVKQVRVYFAGERNGGAAP